MNTLRIADALENFDVENNNNDIDVSGAMPVAATAWNNGGRHGGRKASKTFPFSPAKRRARSSEQVHSRPANTNAVRPLKEVQMHKTNTDPSQKEGNQSCIPRYAWYTDPTKAQFCGDSTITMLRCKVNVKNTDFTAEYDLGGTIGQGTFGKVKKATEKNKSGHKQVVAVKILGGKSFGTNELKAFLNECDILSEIAHPNVPLLHGVHEYNRKYAMIMEYASGGELFERIQAQGSFNEEAAANITRQLLSVLKYIHEKKVAHRDLKPENILFANSERDLTKAQVKLIDFGFAKRMADCSNAREALPPMLAQTSFQTRLGSPNYVAPEILTSKAGYGVEVDVWSLGVILYIMLCGYFPFYHENERELYRQIRRGNFEMPAEDWGHVSDAAKDLVNSMLKTDPRLRVSASDCLRHPWIAKPGVASKQPFPQASRDKLDMFLDSQKKVPRLKKVMDAVFNPFRTPPSPERQHGNGNVQTGAEYMQTQMHPPPQVATHYHHHRNGAGHSDMTGLDELETSPLRPESIRRHPQGAGCTGKCSIM